MRILVTGASGTLGTALLRRLAEAVPPWSITAVCRRTPPPREDPGQIDWHRLDLLEPGAQDRLTGLMDGAEAVVHLAWALRPRSDLDLLERTNIKGSRTVFEAIRAAGVNHLVHASSVAAYAPAPDKPFVNEDWPLRAVSSSSYARHKVQVEHDLDALESVRPNLIVTRLRPGLVLNGHATKAISRFFLGRLTRAIPMARRLHLPAFPSPRGLLLPVVHADDVAEGILRSLRRRPVGGINLASDDPISGPLFAEALGTRLWELPPPAIRRLVGLSWRAHLQPTDRGWFDLAMSVPLLDTDRARRELDWRPKRTTADALAEMLSGVNREAGPVPSLPSPRRPRGADRKRARLGP